MTEAPPCFQWAGAIWLTNILCVRMNRMASEPQSEVLDDAGPPVRGPRQSSSRPIRLAAVGALALAAAGVSWWNWHRPEKSFSRGREALRAGDRQQVLREARQLQETPGFEPHGRLLSGLLLLRSGKPAEALTELQQAAQGESTALEAMTAAAECYYQLGQYIEVIDTAHAVLARNAEALDARRWLAAAYYDLGDLSDAVTELQTISTQSPDDPKPERLLGLIYKDNERFTEAVEHYRESIRRGPQQDDRQLVLLELAESLIRLSRFDESLQTLTDCDLTARSLALKAECLEGLGRADEAKGVLRQAIEIEPAYLPPVLQLAKLLLEAGRADEAVGMLQDAVRTAPHNGRAHYQLSQAYTRLGQQAKAAEELQLFQEAQQSEREFTDLHLAAAKNPSDADVRYRLGVLSRQFQKPELARVWFRAALAIHPGHGPARLALSEIDPNPDGR